MKKKDPYFAYELTPEQPVKRPAPTCPVCHGAGEISVAEGTTLGTKKCALCARVPREEPDLNSGE